MPLGMELGLSPGDFVLDGDPALPSPKKGAEPSPQFSDHFYCGQTVARIKMPLGMEVPQPRGLCIRWGPRSPPPKFSADIYYSYYDFVSRPILHSAQSILVCSSSSSSFSILCKQKWLNQSICRLSCGLVAKKTSLIVFARWRQCALMAQHIGVVWGI